MEEGTRHRIPLRRRLWRWGLGLLAGLLAILVLATALFYWRRDWVERKLFETLGELQSGAISVEDIHFAPLSQLPDVSIRLDGVTYYEHQPGERKPEEQPILQVKTVYIAFDLWALLQGRIDVSSLTFRDGAFRLLFYPDNSFNLFNAFGIRQARPEHTARGRGASAGMDLRLDGIRLINLEGRVEHQGLPLTTRLHIDRLIAGFRYQEQVDAVRLRCGLQLQEVILRERGFRPDKNVQLDLDFLLDEQTMLSRLRRGTLAVEGLQFDLTGTYLLRDAGWIDLELSASDEELTLLSYLVEEKVIDRNLDLLRRGNLYLNGTVRGETFNHLPEIAFNFGAEELHLDIPGEAEPIEELGFSGFFTTGEADDLSESLLRIDNLSGRLPGGYLRGRLEVTNFLDPFFRLHCDLRTRIDGWDKAFKLGRLDSLSGTIALVAGMEGSLDGDERGRFSPRDSLRLELNDAALRWPGFSRRFTGLNGTLRNREADLLIEALQGRYGGSRLKVRGRLPQALPRLLGGKPLPGADLWLRADRIQPREWPWLGTLSWLPDGEEITNLAADFSLRVPSDARKRTRQGNVVLQVRQGRAAFQQLPDIRQLSGAFRLPRRKNAPFSFVLKELEADLKPGGLSWRDGRLQVNGNKITASGVLGLDGVPVHRWIYGWGTPKGPGAAPSVDTTQRLSGRLPFSGSYHAAARRIDSLTVQDGDLTFRYRDTGMVRLDGLDLSLAQAVFQRPIKPPAVFSHLKGEAQVNAFRSGMFDAFSFRCVVEGRKNFYSIGASVLEKSGVVEEGIVTIDLSRRQPAYRLRYHLATMPAERLFRHFDRTPRLHGPVSFTVDLSTNGRDAGEWLRQAGGTLHIEGRDLRLIGVDLKDQLTQLQAGRPFRLIGLGAYWLPGPFGATLTRGLDFTDMLGTPFQPGHETPVVHLISSWRLKDGVLESRDLGLTTPRFRIGAQGRIRLPADSLELLRVAVVDDQGCALFSQRAAGPYRRLRFRQSGLGGLPADTVFDVRTLAPPTPCTPFYRGALRHPQRTGQGSSATKSQD